MGLVWGSRKRFGAHEHWQQDTGGGEGEYYDDNAAAAADDGGGEEGVGDEHGDAGEKAAAMRERHGGLRGTNHATKVKNNCFQT